MTWNSPAEFFAMGGYAFYVWGSFGVTALALLIEPLLLKKRLPWQGHLNFFCASAYFT